MYRFSTNILRYLLGGYREATHRGREALWEAMIDDCECRVTHQCIKNNPPHIFIRNNYVNMYIKVPE